MTKTEHTKPQAPHTPYEVPFWMFTLVLLFAIGVTGVWSFYKSDQAIIADIAFLTEGASRLLNGQSMSQAVYDTNPPLNILLYAPAVWISKLGGIPVYYATFIYPLIAVILSSLATHALLKHFKELCSSSLLTISVSYLLIATILAGYDFGQKDHLVALALFPLSLQQILMTRKENAPKLLSFTVLIFGAIVILVKPHLGLIPALIFAHRALWQNRLTVIFDKDFLFLSGAFTGYLLVIFVFFGDFVSTILPDIMRYYLDWEHNNQFFTSLAYIAIANGASFAICLYLKPRYQNIILGLLVFSFAAAVSFYIQNRGFSYQLFPAKLFTLSALSLILHAVITRFINAKSIGLILCLLSMCMATYFLRVDNQNFTHQNYLNSEIAQEIIKTECDKTCSFYMFSFASNMSYELSAYTGYEYASRFPALWFLTPIISKRLNGIAEEEKTKEDLARFSRYILEDFASRQPDILIIGQFPFLIDDNKNTLEFKDFFDTKTPEWKKFWARYQHNKTINVSYKEMTGDTFAGQDAFDFKIYRKTQHQ